LRDCNRAFARPLAKKIGAEGLTIGTWYFLRVLWENDGISQLELSRRIGMMEPTTVTAVSQLERDGLVRRRMDPSDKGRRMVCLTERGRRLKAIALSGLSLRETGHLWMLLGRVKSNLETAMAEEN